MKHLSPSDIEEIRFLARQGPGKVNRIRLTCNLFKITKEQLYEIVLGENQCQS